MGLNTSKSEQLQQGVRDLAIKLQLERVMIIALRRLFSVMANDMAALLAATGQLIRAEDYIDELKGILRTQYRRVISNFSGQIVDFLKENINNDEVQLIQDFRQLSNLLGVDIEETISGIENEAVVALALFITQNVESDAAFITRTTNKDLTESLLLATATLESPTNTELAKASRTLFKKKSFNRTGTIAATVTQKGAEGVKQIERDAISTARSSIDARIAKLPELKEEEVWITMGDDIVRQSHLDAHFQRKKNGVFTVQNQLLRFPGDKSLGATPDNILNCRCSAVSVIE